LKRATDDKTTKRFKRATIAKTTNLFKRLNNTPATAGAFNRRNQCKPSK